MKEEQEEKPKKNLPPLNALSLVTQIGINIIANIAVTLFIGNWLDNFLGTRPVFLLIFVFLGVGSATLSIYKTTQKFF